jgi:hypothetical protein
MGLVNVFFCFLTILIMMMIMMMMMMMVMIIMVRVGCLDHRSNPIPRFGIKSPSTARGETQPIRDGGGRQPMGWPIKHRLVYTKCTMQRSEHGETGNHILVVSLFFPLFDAFP